MKPRDFRIRRLLSAGIAAILLLLSSAALAQSDGAERPTADITERQVELNEEGVRAIIDGDHQKAVAVLSESLAYGEANATYLNLGRAYQKLGKCKEARKALDKALTAPAVDDPPPRVIDKKAKQYLAELDESCPTEEEPAKEDTAEEPTETEQDSADATKDTQKKDETVEPPPETRDEGGSNALAWTSLAGGVAIGAGGVVMHVLAQQKRNEVWNAGFADGSKRVRDVSQQEAEDARQQANTFNTIGLSANIVGGVLAGVGTYLLLTGDSSEAARLDLQIGPDRAAAVFEWRF